MRDKAPVLFWFLLPWLIILLVPQLRLMAPAQILGSEYAAGWALTWTELGGGYPLQPPLPPTAAELTKRFAAGQAPPEISLKAPEERGDALISPETARRVLDSALQKPDAPPWLIVLRLRLAMSGLDSQRLFPAQMRFDWGSPDSADYFRLPIAGREEWRVYEDVSGGIAAPEPSEVVTKLSQKPLNLALPKFAEPLKWARRGAQTEPDNAFWPLHIAYILTLAQHDDAATREILAAARCTRYDTHKRDEIVAALGVARLQRPLLWHEKIAVADRQTSLHFYPLFDQALLWQSQRAEEKHDLSVIAALARVASLMQRGAAFDNERRRALLLQSAAWGGATRPAQVTVGALKLPMWPQQLETFEYRWFRAYKLTPLQFAQPFAAVAKKQGQPALARETLALGRAAVQNVAHLLPTRDEKSYGTTPTPLITATIADFNAQMVLLQIQLTLFAWLVLNFVLWRRLAWVGRYWRALSLLWRKRSETDDETPVALTHSARDLRMAVWACGALILCGAMGITWWNMKLLEWSPVFEDHLTDHIDKHMLSYFFFVGGPLLGGIAWCGGTALRCYAQMPRPIKTQPESEHVPPSVIPSVIAFMLWSITLVPLGCWLLWLLTQILGPAAMNIVFSPQWATQLGQSNLNLATRDIGTAFFFTVAAFGLWTVKWIWQLPAPRRILALNFGVRYLRATLGVWAILGSWLYLAFLLVALPHHRAANTEIDKILPPTELSRRGASHS